MRPIRRRIRPGEILRPNLANHDLSVGFSKGQVGRYLSGGTSEGALPVGGRVNFWRYGVNPGPKPP